MVFRRIRRQNDRAFRLIPGSRSRLLHRGANPQQEEIPIPSILLVDLGPEDIHVPKRFGQSFMRSIF
jgi:hypothetical protein